MPIAPVLTAIGQPDPDDDPASYLGLLDGVLDMSRLPNLAVWPGADGTTSWRVVRLLERWEDEYGPLVVDSASATISLPYQGNLTFRRVAAILISWAIEVARSDDPQRITACLSQFDLVLTAEQQSHARRIGRRSHAAGRSQRETNGLLAGAVPVASRRRTVRAASGTRHSLINRGPPASFLGISVATTRFSTRSSYSRTVGVVASQPTPHGADSDATDPPDRDPDPQRSPWEGMSGAAVFANERRARRAAPCPIGKWSTDRRVDPIGGVLEPVSGLV